MTEKYPELQQGQPSLLQNIIPDLTICTSYYAAIHGTTKEPESGSHAATWSSGGIAEVSEEPPGSGV